MKTYCKDVDITNLHFIMNAIEDCISKKIHRYDVLRYINLAIYNERHHLTLEQLFEIYSDPNKWYDLKRNLALKLQRELLTRSIKLAPVEVRKRFDGISNKIRMIGKESIKQQIYDYIAVNACQELFKVKITYYQCGSLPNKGTTSGAKYIMRFLKKHPDKAKYAIKADIKQCYPSVNHSILLKFLYRDIDNSNLLYLITTLIQSYGDIGLMIGSYLSQYLCNYFLSYAYHYVTEQTHYDRNTKRHGKTKVLPIHFALFYMDDILLIGSNKIQLRKAFLILEEYITNSLDLEVKDDWKLFRIEYIKYDKVYGEPINMLGYRFRADNKISLRRNVFIRFKKNYTMVKQLFASKTRINNMTLVYGLASRNGYVKYGKLSSIKLSRKYNGVFKFSRKVISEYTKKLNKTK